MKTNIVVWTFPLVLVIAGCQQKASAPAGTVSARETNAVVADADNTARNQRDRGDATLTPGDQGTSPADRELSREIRKTLVTGPGDFSVAAKNIKVITVNGKVTLRGPVSSEAEKTAIARVARSVVGDGNVDDQLEVKGNP